MTEIEIKNIIPVTNQHLFTFDVYNNTVALEVYNNAENFFHCDYSFHDFTKNDLREGIMISWEENYFNLPKNLVIDCYRLL